MALIKCPECRKKISDLCESCPNCGYPIKASKKVVIDEVLDATDQTPPKGKKPIFKRVWFWISIATVAAAMAVTVILLYNSDVNPKVDENGKPVFVELTDEVYTNVDEYLGYHVNVKGKVFQNLGDNGEIGGVQVWFDPDNCEQNLMIHYTTDEALKDGDYVICTGYIKDLHTYTNTYGAEMSVPLIYSTDLRSATYIEVMSPTISTITPENLTYEKYGYSIGVEKIELAENETRVYLSATNNGNSTLYVDAASSIIVQDGKQFNSETNYEANYEQLPYTLSKGATASGIVAFPAIGDGEFNYVIDLHSNNYEEQFETVTFKLGKETSSVFVPVVEPNAVWEFDGLKHETNGYIIGVEKVEFYDNETRIYLVATNNGKATLYVDADGSIIVQNKKQFNTELLYSAEYEALPYSIVKGASATGTISFPTIEATEFEYTIHIQSDDYNEEFEDIVFLINANTSYCKNDKEEEPAQEPTQAPTEKADASQNWGTNETVDRRQEAVKEVEYLADAWFPVSRFQIWNLLTEAVFDMWFEPFTSAEAEYAIANANVDWAASALSLANIHIEDVGMMYTVSEGEIVSMLKELWFTDSEIAYAVSNCNLE